MDATDRSHCLQQAREHEAMAARERELAKMSQLEGDAVRAQRHLLDATLHEKRADAYAEAARAPRPGGAQAGGR